MVAESNTNRDEEQSGIVRGRLRDVSQRVETGVERAKRLAERPGERLVEEFWSNRHARRALATVAAVNGIGAAGVARAQVSAANDFLCGTGAGQALGLVLGLAVLLLLGIAAIRGLMAFNKMGAAREDKKREGREQLKGAGITGAGMFVPAGFGVLLDTLGVGAFSCVDWGSIVGTGTAAIVPVATALPF